jgi:hypothetical protein
MKLVVDFGLTIGQLQTSAQLTDYSTEELLGRPVVGAVNLGTKRHRPAPCSLFQAGATTSCPVAVQRENYQRNAKHSTAIAAHKVFPGREHYTCGEAGREAVAGFALEWSSTRSRANSIEVAVEK